MQKGNIPIEAKGRSSVSMTSNLPRKVSSHSIGRDSDVVVPEGTQCRLQEGKESEKERTRSRNKPKQERELPFSTGSLAELTKMEQIALALCQEQFCSSNPSLVTVTWLLIQDSTLWRLKRAV